jgi:hypothetical protein
MGKGLGLPLRDGKGEVGFGFWGRLPHPFAHLSVG